MRNKKRCMNYIGQCLEHPQIKVTDIDEVSVADHVICKKVVYDHHDIVLDVDYVGETVKLIGFDGSAINKRRLAFSDLEGSLYKVKYGRGEALDRGEVLRRADRIEREYRRLGGNIPSDKEYSLLFNNCEHFAYYCKVGDRKSVQVKNFTRTAAGVSANVIMDLVRLYLLDGTGNPIPTELTAGSIIAPGIIEAVVTSDDIYRFYQMLQRGSIDEDEFTELVIKRLLIAVISVAGAQLGKIAGFFVAGKIAGFFVAGKIAGFSVAGPVGLFLGGVGLFLGGILGNIFGRLVGRAMGEAVVFGKDVVLELLERYGSHLHDD